MRQPGLVKGQRPGPSMQEILARGQDEIPAPLSAQSSTELGDGDIPYDRYLAREIFDLEMERLWPRVWQWTCRIEHIPEVGDYYVYEIGDTSILVVHTKKGIRAYYNSCLHRGTKLRAANSSGSTERFRCPFHGWTWDLDGELVDLPCAWDLPQVDCDRFRLPEVKVGLWGGFVFINLDPAAPPLEQYLGVLPEHFANWDLSRRFTELHIEKELPCNWKLAQEAFMESYHTMETHPQLLPTLGDINTQYDVFGENVSRYYSASGVSSPYIDPPLSEDQLISNMFMGDRSIVGDGPTLADGQTARQAMARHLRSTFKAHYGADLSAHTDTEIIDTIGYGLFPNTTFFAGFSVPMVYRFRPLDNDHQRSLFEILFLRPVADDGTPPPPPAEPYRIGVEDSYTTVPGMDRFLAQVFDQDTRNLKAQQEGIKTSRKAGATLTRYQEIRIRHMHRTWEKYCHG